MLTSCSVYAHYVCLYWSSLVQDQASHSVEFHFILPGLMVNVSLTRLDSGHTWTMPHTNEVDSHTTICCSCFSLAFVWWWCKLLILTLTLTLTRGGNIRCWMAERSVRVCLTLFVCLFSVLDVSHNRIEDVEVIDILGQMPDLVWPNRYCLNNSLLSLWLILVPPKECLHEYAMLRLN